MKPTDEQLAKITDPSHPIFIILERVRKIEDGMVKNDPEIKTHLKEIWKQCQTYEELAHLLTPEQIGIFMKGMQKYSGQYLIVEAPKAKSTRGKKVGMDDIT